MAPVWNAALAALEDARAPGRFEAFARQAVRSPDALARVAVEYFQIDGSAEPLRFVTLSFSGSVLHVVRTLAHLRTVALACSEARPALEGRRLAASVPDNVPVTFFTDAAIGHALVDATAVLVGADAVTPEWFMNKSGTRMLAAAATQQGVPVYVLAARDKFVSREVAARLSVREGPVREVWDLAPAHVTVRNPYFEQISLDLVTAVFTDFGVLGAGLVPEVCQASWSEDLARTLNEIG
jgi:translation initiation factor 2B subunit (eIF-2B alpha/beta/delta family)